MQLTPPPPDPSPRSRLVELVMQKVPLLPGVPDGIRAGYLAACLAAIGAGAPVVGVSGLSFLAIAAVTESPVLLASVGGLLVAGLVDAGGVSLFPSNAIFQNAGGEALGAAVYCVAVALLAVVDDDVELGVGMDGGVNAAVSRVDEVGKVEGARAESSKRAAVRTELGLSGGVDRSQPTAAADDGGHAGMLADWDARLDDLPPM
jgi:hypothetical protein